MGYFDRSAKEAAKLRQEMDIPSSTEQAAAPPPEPERVPTDYGALGDIGADEAVVRLAEVVGEPDTWPVRGVLPEDIAFMHTCCDRCRDFC